MICKVNLSREEAEALRTLGDGSVIEGIHVLAERHANNVWLKMSDVALPDEMIERINRLAGGWLTGSYVRRVMEKHVDLMEGLDDESSFSF